MDGGRWFGTADVCGRPMQHLRTRGHLCLVVGHAESCVSHRRRCDACTLAQIPLLSKPFHVKTTMNCDNFLGDKPSTRVRAPPGGRTSLDLFGGYVEPAPAAAPARAPLAPAPVYASFGSAAPAPVAAAAAKPAPAAKPEGTLRWTGH